MDYNRLDDNAFLLQSHIDNVIIIYFPLLSKAFWTKDVSRETIIQAYDNVKKNKCIDTELEKKIKKIISGKTNKVRQNAVGMNYNRVVLLLTDMCNLDCRYCYAHDSRSQRTLSFEKIVQVVDMVLNNVGNNKHFTFLGGGEPTVQWELLSKSIEYIREKEASKNATISIQTNATLLDSKKIKYLKKHNVTVGCSFDILPEIQNNQRPFAYMEENTFDYVDYSIRELLNNKIIPGIRTTIALGGCSKMPEMIDFVAREYKGINQVHFEHVSEHGLNWENYYCEFCKYYFEAQKIAKDNNIYLKNSTISSLNAIRNRFCGGEFCITPSGSIVACHRVSSENDFLFDLFTYGYVDKKVIIDEVQRNKVDKIFGKRLAEECGKCFGKNHCAGQCSNNKLQYTKNESKELCNFTQEMMLSELEYKIGIV